MVAHPSPEAGPYDRDTLSGIVDRYLTPAFQVDVYEVRSAITGTMHPVVWVPSHEAAPVCSARGGPERNGKPVGIAQATHYTRVPGSEVRADLQAGVVDADYSALRSA